MMDKKTIPNLTIRDHHVILTNLTQSEHKSQILFSFIPLSAKKPFKNKTGDRRGDRTLLSARGAHNYSVSTFETCRPDCRDPHGRRHK